MKDVILIPLLSLRGAERRSNPYFTITKAVSLMIHGTIFYLCVGIILYYFFRLLRLSAPRNDGYFHAGVCFCHCELTKSAQQTILYNNKNGIVNNKQNNLFYCMFGLFCVFSGLLRQSLHFFLAMTEYSKIALPAVLAMTERGTIAVLIWSV
ncbi:MAG: hypothetical protein LBP54_05475 [Campylobacteraceae bacterium]|nr:hypothetical protein [Campylobacteraceae bacterium]